MAGFKLSAYVVPALLFCAAIPAGPVLAHADDLACEQEGPLLVLEWESLVLDPSNPNVIGEWRLPLSVSRPEIITEARLELKMVLETPSSEWKARLHFTFPDPKPLGIPFTFQKAELSWITAEGIITHRLDWSNSCTNPGRGLYPRQEWQSELELSGTHSTTQILHPVLKIWGSRN